MPNEWYKKNNMKPTPLKQETKDALRLVGCKGETWDAIVSRILVENGAGVPVSQDTKVLLASLGNKNETFEKIILRLASHYFSCEKPRVEE